MSERFVEGGIVFFSLDGVDYRVRASAYLTDLILLPDGTYMLVTEWIEDTSPVPKQWVLSEELPKSKGHDDVYIAEQIQT